MNYSLFWDENGYILEEDERTKNMDNLTLLNWQQVIDDAAVTVLRLVRERDACRDMLQLLLDTCTDEDARLQIQDFLQKTAAQENVPPFLAKRDAAGRGYTKDGKYIPIGNPDAPIQEEE